MERKVKSRKLCCMSAVLFLLILFWGLNSVQAFTAGKAYDKSNYEEIKDLLPTPPLPEWITKDGWVIQTGELEAEWKFDESYMQATSENEGKYDVNSEGLLVSKQTGELPDFVFGFPFPNIDPADPKAGEKIMENNTYCKYQMGGMTANAKVVWVGENGPERHIIALGDYLYYNNRRSGKNPDPIPNPNNFLQQQMTYVSEPFELRGMVQMSWTYNSTDADSSWAYVPMLRRIRRVSAAVRSDPFLGSDFCTDDAQGWAGKNMDMEWKLIEKKEVLLPFATNKKLIAEQLPNGSIRYVDVHVKMGWEDPNWKGAPWVPTSVVWVKRPVYIVQAIPKDPYYNYGRHLFYVDASTHHNFLKVIWDKSGDYWKTVVIGWAYQEVSEDLIVFGNSAFYMVVDSKTHHATVAREVEYTGRDHVLHHPISEYGPQVFTESNIRSRSK